MSRYVIVGAGGIGVTIAAELQRAGREAERVALRRFRSVIGGVLWRPASYLGAGEVSAPGWPAAGTLGPDDLLAIVPELRPVAAATGGG